MIKINNYTLEQIQKNLQTFNKKMVSKNMNTNFWVIADRADFKPLKKDAGKKTKKTQKSNKVKTNIHSIKEIRDNILEEKGEYYKDKKFAEIKIDLDENLLSKVNDIKQYKNIKDKTLLTVHIIIYLIGSDGSLNLENKWELMVFYLVDDFRTLNFKLKNIEVLMRLAADSVITTDSIKGISYKKLLLKLEKNKED
jgi:hypothetical protein